MASMKKPMVQKTTPAMSLPLPNDGWGYLSTFGEFRMVTGRLTVQTQSICATQKPRNLKKWSRLPSNLGLSVTIKCRYMNIVMLT